MSGLRDDHPPPYELVAHLQASDVSTLAEAHLRELERINSTTVRITDKMPENYMYLGWLSILFPRVRFIRCVRDPRDIAVSTLITSFRGVRWSNSDDDLIHRFGQYRRLIDHWKAVIPERVLDVVYEDTVNDPESQARRMIDWIGLPWHDACLDHLNSKGVVRTASISQARKPIYKTSKERWRNYQPFLGSLFQQLTELLPDDSVVSSWSDVV